MARRRKRRTKQSGGRWSVGGLIATLAALFWVAEERDVAIFFSLLGLPYLAFYAPVKCGGYRSDGQPCGNNGYGLLIGCGWHTFQRIRRIFGMERKARRPGRAIGATGSARSGGIPPRVAAGEPTRSRASDTITLLATIVGSTAGVLALFIDPGA